MFVLTRLSDVIPVAPDLFDADYTQVLTEEIDRKYANKVIADVGLCVTMYDFVSIGDAFVHPSDGTSHSQGRSARCWRYDFSVWKLTSLCLQWSSEWSCSGHSWVKCSRAES